MWHSVGGSDLRLLWRLQSTNHIQYWRNFGIDGIHEPLDISFHLPALHLQYVHVCTYVQIIQRYISKIYLLNIYVQQVWALPSSCTLQTFCTNFSCKVFVIYVYIHSFFWTNLFETIYIYMNSESQKSFSSIYIYTKDRPTHCLFTNHLKLRTCIVHVKIFQRCIRCGGRRLILSWGYIRWGCC